jgi:hypothetical protein
MSDYQDQTPVSSGFPAKFAVLAGAGLYVVLSLFLMFGMRSRISSLEAGQANMKTEASKADQHMDSMEASLRDTSSALAEKLGMTQKELQARTAQLARQQRTSVTRLRKEQTEQIQGVKTDVASTRTDLQETKAKLDRTVGDLGVQSGLIARTRDDLDLLKRRGERNYYEFSLVKGQRARVGGINLTLKKADVKRGKYTLYVTADDRTIEKKDRTMYEPLQFYTGRERQLFEVVVFNVEKSRVSGYLSTPKELMAAQSQAQSQPTPQLQTRPQ